MGTDSSSIKAMENIIKAIDMLDTKPQEAIKMLKANRKDLSEHLGQQRRQPTQY
jgi:hypothetical protein